MHLHAKQTETICLGHLCHCLNADHSLETVHLSHRSIRHLRAHLQMARVVHECSVRRFVLSGSLVLWWIAYNSTWCALEHPTYKGNKSAGKGIIPSDIDTKV